MYQDITVYLIHICNYYLSTKNNNIYWTLHHSRHWTEIHELLYWPIKHLRVYKALEWKKEGRKKGKKRGREAHSLHQYWHLLQISSLLLMVFFKESLYNLSRPISNVTLSQKLEWSSSWNQSFPSECVVIVPDTCVIPTALISCWRHLVYLWLQHCVLCETGWCHIFFILSQYIA